MQCLFRGNLLKNSEPKIRSCFLYLVKGREVIHFLPREVIRFALRRKGDSEYLVDRGMSLYKGCKTTVSVDGELSISCSVKVGVRQRSALSLLLFIMVTDVLTEDVMDGSLMELLYADDFALCGESFSGVMDK